MTLKSINPTRTSSWGKLQEHFNTQKEQRLDAYFKNNSDRADSFKITLDQIALDFSKNRMDQETLNLLIELANEVDLKDGIGQLFSGAKINKTEGRAVLHTALRNFDDSAVLVDGADVMPEVKTSLDKIKTFSEAIISGQIKGYSGRPFTDVVNIGIGGSDLGPNMVVEALSYYKNHLKLHYISNIDGDHVMETLKGLNPETTLFIIVSKTFTTQETLTNALTVKEWFLQNASKEDIASNFVAVSTNLEKVADFGIHPDRVFTMWNWVGGRYSLWSAVGLSISLAIGYENFKSLLEGAADMDTHFKTADFDKNIPVVLALISIWYTNFYGAESEVVIPYSQYLKLLVPYLQQLSMESNGKSIDRNGEEIAYQTGAIIWGNTGTNVQHAFMQLVHQGTKLIPVDFIGFSESLYGNDEHHKKLMANYYAQAEALAFGKSKESVHLELKMQQGLEAIEELLPYKTFEGNRPSNSLLITKLTPRTLGSLLAIYEHKTFVQGYIWNIFSFDQFGVELGKELAKKLLK